VIITACIINSVTLFIVCIVLGCVALARAADECSAELSTTAESLNYWTPERMAAAVPRDMIFNPALGKFQVKQLACAGSWVLHNTTRAPYSKYPFSAVGKIFFTLGANNYVCSGSITDAHTVVTAGHCTFDSENGFASNLIIVPGYFNRSEPFGRFAASSLCTTSQFQSGGMSYDYGIARFQTALPISATGVLTLIANLDPAKTEYESHGYPQGPPFDGMYENTCSSDLCGRDWWMANPQPVGISCDSTGGSSGGPWITQGKFLSSVNSYGYGFQPNRMWGPYFDSDTLKFYNKHRIQS